jgi:ABC-type multidrug transport system fused ATPase/permease subunit
VNQNLRLHLVDRLQALSLRFHSDSRVGDAIYRMYQDSAMVTQIIDVLFLSPIRAFFGFVIGLVGVAIFNPGLALALAMVIPPILLLGLWISWRLRVRFRSARETNSALTSRIQESLSGIKVIKAYGLEDFERGRFEVDSLRAFDAAFTARNLLAVLGVAVFWITSVMVLGAVFWGTLQTRDTGSLWLWGLLEGTGPEGFLLTLALTAWTLGSYNNFKFLLGQGSGAVERIMRVWGRTQDIAIGLDRVFEVLDIEPEEQDEEGAVAMPPFRSSIAFDDVSFRYQTDRPVLEHVSLEARSGSIVAIVGPTGSGKSTLMALLLRLFDPQSGSIAIDGRDLRSLQVESLRQNVAIALQENVLFGTTVRENIRYAVPLASDAEVREAARVACADGFIEALTEGYDTLLGERGTKLSTGQRQRLSIARAILKGSPILVLDEPTASLDAETELRLLGNLAEWGRGRVIFLITHRLSTIRRADQIVYLAAGRVGETGSHDELMQRAGSAYRHLVEAEEGQRAGAAGGPA